MMVRWCARFLLLCVAVGLTGCGKAITARDARARSHPESDLSRSPLPGGGATSSTPSQHLLRDLALDASILPQPRRQIVESALAMAGASARGLDCSKLVQDLYASAGEGLPRTVARQLESGTPVDLEHLKPGDLLFFAFETRPADHVGVFAGQDLFVHVSSSARAVRVESLSKRAFAQAHVAGRRFLD
jgi:cell wall-associated NlpC family hydrolase